MAIGKVRWFDEAKGYGFITDAKGEEIFVHFSAIVGKGFKTLSDNASVTFEIIESDRGLQASHVKVND
mgnify:CR=1 FL=1